MSSAARGFHGNALQEFLGLAWSGTARGMGTLGSQSPQKPAKRDVGVPGSVRPTRCTLLRLRLRKQDPIRINTGENTGADSATSPRSGRGDPLLYFHCTVVLTMAALFAVFGSGVSAVAAAFSVITLPDGAVTFTVSRTVHVVFGAMLLFSWQTI